MKRYSVFMAGVLTALTMPSQSAAQQPTASPRYADWRTVAQSDLIIRGRLHVPAAALRSTLGKKNPGYVVLTVDVTDAIKGRMPVGPLRFNYYTEPAWYAPDPKAVLAADGSNVLLFLLKADDVDGSSEGNPAKTSFYFAGATQKSLQHYRAGVGAAVRAEVFNQARIVATFSRSASAKLDKMDSTVRRIIGRMLDKKTEEQAFRDLTALGGAGVPATIRQMNDRRPLPVKAITVPASWEYAHYSPQNVVDALSTLLKGMANESFRFISNGGTERERSVEVDAWRVYLCYANAGTAGRPDWLKHVR